MTAQEFVAQLDGENQKRLSLLAPADTLKPAGLSARFRLALRY